MLDNALMTNSYRALPHAGQTVGLEGSVHVSQRAQRHRRAVIGQLPGTSSLLVALRRYNHARHFVRGGASCGGHGGNVKVMRTKLMPHASDLPRHHRGIQPQRDTDNGARIGQRILLKGRS